MNQLSNVVASAWEINIKKEGTARNSMVPYTLPVSTLCVRSSPLCLRKLISFISIPSAFFPPPTGWAAFSWCHYIKRGKEITIDLGKFRNYFCVHGNSMKICLAQRVFQ